MGPSPKSLRRCFLNGFASFSMGPSFKESQTGGKCGTDEFWFGAKMLTRWVADCLQAELKRGRFWGVGWPCIYIHRTWPDFIGYINYIPWYVLTFTGCIHLSSFCWIPKWIPSSRVSPSIECGAIVPNETTNQFTKVLPPQKTEDREDRTPTKNLQKITVPSFFGCYYRL